MLNTEHFDADIIVAGAGPSGLVVSCEAALGGARVLTLEKRGEPSWSRAGNLTSRVLELFASRGLADRILKRAFELHTEPRTASGIWAGLPGLRYEGLETDYPFVLFLSQIEIERMLTEHLKDLGGDLRLRHEVLGFDQDETGVSVRVRTEAQGERTFRARYLVGADGNKSSVRTAAGIPFEGHAATKYAYNVDARIRNPYPGVSTFFHSEAGWAMAYPLRDTVTRLAFIDAQTCRGPQSESTSFDEAMAMLRRVHGSDFDIREVEAITRFHDAMFLAARMRERRVFLVGESVRIHYPASGVGMNFCIQDAFNLGWKLAAVAAGRAADSLLDTYEQERRPQIEALLDDVRRQCAIQFNFDDEHAALKRFLQDVLIPMPDVNRRLCENLSGLGARYERGEGSHPSVGQRMPNLKLTDAEGETSSVFEQLRGQDFLLLDLTGGVAPRALAGLRMKTASLTAPVSNSSLQGAATVLVRPDGYIAWAGEQACSEYFPFEELARWLPSAGRLADR
ncbi:FAD-dependent monooxygenase [Steroidobacter sp.]|uniref:FAD-dependent monooxygenase n=1 Tax=Steroidobacter sp. TaxID=1978227 RepID=UPI001A535BCE|nr:FAD-dependent monooxygenase [Steroidobacter sp.]MBL8264746.1 FAD-dependent monooxygenase [Steroidobacter sp.]